MRLPLCACEEWRDEDAAVVEVAVLEALEEEAEEETEEEVKEEAEEEADDAALWLAQGARIKLRVRAMRARKLLISSGEIV